MTWQAFSASVRGSSHVKDEKPCQDAHCYEITEGYVIAAVADGLGTASASDKGAELAVQMAVTAIQKELTDGPLATKESWTALIAGAFKHARSALEVTAEKDGIPLRDLGTTLICAVMTNYWLAVGHLGDGAAVTLDGEGTMKTISPPLRGEYANEVMPLTAPQALESVRYSVEQASFAAMALTTDGLQMLSINSKENKPHAPFFAPFFEAACASLDTEKTETQLRDFLNSERVCERTEDDKTLLVIGKLSSDESHAPIAADA